MGIRELRENYYHTPKNIINSQEDKPSGQETVEEWMVRTGKKPDQIDVGVVTFRSDLEKGNENKRANK